MGRWINPGAVILTATGLFFSVAAGCRSGAPTITPENHLSELEFEKSRTMVALRESVLLERATGTNLRTQEEEKDLVLRELSQKETALRFAGDQVRKLSAERAEQEKALTELRESEKKIRESHEKLKDLAFNSTQELSEFKGRAESAAQTKDKLSVENKAIAKHLEVATRELDDLKGELIRTRAVVRSLQEHEPVKSGSGAEAALRSRICELERTLAEVTGSRDAVDGGPGPSIPAAAPRPAAQEPDQKALLNGLLSLVGERIEAAKKGEFEWDALEIALAGMLAAAIFFPVAALVVLLRGRGYRRQLSELRVRAASVPDDDLDQAVDAAGLGVEHAPRQGSTRTTEEAPAKAVSRRSTYVPREDRDFSAIISSPRGRRERAEAPAAELAPASPSARPAEPAGRPARARQERSAEARIEAALPLEPERSRAIDKVFEEVAPKGRPVSPVRGEARPKPPAPKARDAEEDAVEGEDMASTQIISPLKASEPPFMSERQGSKAAEPAKVRVPEEPAGKGKGKTESEDRELLDELKDIINKKFDELMKK